MKKRLYQILLCLIILSACDSAKPLPTGVDNSPSLAFIGEPRNYSGGVTIKIDEKETFFAEVMADFKNSPNGKVYAVPTGKHFVTVVHNGTIIFKKLITIKGPGTKKIFLP